MNEPKHNHHRLESAARDHVHRPRWEQHLHRNWRVWVCMLLMLIAMALFVMGRTLVPRAPIESQSSDTARAR